jgi:hypothetical protein
MSDRERIAACGWRHDAEWQASMNVAMRGEWDQSIAPLPECFKHDRLKLAALMGREPCPGDPNPRWHISVSAPDDVPEWSLLVRAAHDLRPGVVFCVGVPPRSMWMNVHPNVLHLYELRDEPLIATYRDNAKGHTPT